MTHNNEHENYLLNNILANSISSKNPSNEAKELARKNSYSYFEDLKNNLLISYNGMKLTDIKGSKVIGTDYGETLKIIDKQKIDFNLKDNDFKNQMNHNLKLLPGIGIKTEEKLKNEGFKTISSLKNHDKYSNSASKLMSNIDEMSFSQVVDLLSENKYTKKCRNNLIKCISLTDYENLKFMDIETLGLSNVPIILIGVAEIKNDKIISSQYFLRDYSEESAIIDAYLSHLDEDSVHLTFNGKRFDVPFIRNRCLYNRIDLKMRLPHVDLMLFARNLWKDQIPNFKLQTIEKELFGIERVDDVPGQYIPDYYKTYLSKNNIGSMIPIIEHNRQDIVSLASFLMKMYGDVN
ncbi:hypothetical protein MBORA_20180 [Methanobrevibacter oralis]|uniref:YprB ribonuclease H-like domain-containing protein n=1 Tax=Methanobrevibacter oralis TaxID=66851 RepID=A0A165YWM9_METOA|nr:ribonuclease H-like domain-containing protein [Methanobrevibacter oralis]KZX09956.1 hypothetical protein MBORA_20180 [Methanobrevibacter oralis]